MPNVADIYSIDVYSPNIILQQSPGTEEDIVYRILKVTQRQAMPTSSVIFNAKYFDSLIEWEFTTKVPLVLTLVAPRK